MSGPGYPERSLGPFPGGVVDAANPLTIEGKGVLRYARNGVLSGLGRLIVRPGTEVAITLMDDQGAPVACTSVCAVIAFGDGCLAVGHSTITSKFYLYWLNDSLTGWYTNMKVLTVSATATPVGVLWTATAAPVVVLIAEGLGVAYIAHNNAGATFKTMKFDSNPAPATLAAFQADLRGAGLEDTYFRGVVSFQQHLWGWGYGSQAAGDNDRPELLRFSTPFFGAMSAVDNFAVGHRVRSQRERIVSAVVAGDVLQVGLNYALWPVSGFGRNSWDKSRPTDGSYGFAGPLAACEARDGWLYYWSHRGPLRVLGRSRPEPLWPRVEVASAGVINDSTVVASFDSDRDQVIFLYQNPTNGAVRALGAYDTIRDAWLGPDGDIGLGIRCAGLVQATLAPGPAGAPTTASTDTIGNSAATAHWINGESGPGTLSQLEYRIQGSTPWTVATSTIAAGATSYQITGLLAGTAYEWRLKHVRNGQSSAYLGPVAGSQFVTLVMGLLPPTNLTTSLTAPDFKGFRQIHIVWTNSGEGSSTEVHIKKGDPHVSGTLTLIATIDPNLSDYYHGISAQTGTWWIEIRHVASGSDPSVYVGGPHQQDAPD